MNSAREFARFALAGVALSAVVAGCGGGGGGGGNGGPDPLIIAINILADGVVGSPYAQTVQATGGTGARTFSVTSGALPAGLVLNASSGVITGTPSGPAGTADLTVSVTDSGSPAQSDSQDLSIRVADPLAVDPGTAPVATIGAAYNHAITVTGGLPPYHVSGSLPSGLAIDPVGVISGTPQMDALTQSGILSVLDSALPQQQVGVDFKIVVTLEVATTAMPDATGGVPYGENLMPQGGLPDYNWELTGGGLPLGILDPSASGFVGGTPDAFCTSMTSTFDVQVTDSDTPVQLATRQGITLTVNPGVLSIPDSSALAVAAINEPYSFFVGVTPGVAPYNFAVINGSLPNQMTLVAATGQITGIPDTAGTTTFTIQVTDNCGSTASKVHNLIVRPAPQGRNDSIATASQIGNGTFVASISPSGHPNSVFAPDQDYYQVRSFATSTVTVDLSAEGGGIDTVMEIVDSSGNPLTTCVAPAFNSECVNDDEAAGNLDSLLEVRVNAPTTFYIHIVEWRGDARPDLGYRMEISGVN